MICATKTHIDKSIFLLKSYKNTNLILWASFMQDKISENLDISSIYPILYIMDYLLETFGVNRGNYGKLKCFNLSQVFHEFYHNSILGKHAVFSLIKNNGIISITDLISYLNSTLSRKAMHEKGFFSCGCHKL